MNVVDVYILRNPYGIFRYQVPEVFNFSLFKKGIRVLVPFGKNNTLSLGLVKDKLTLEKSDIELKDVFFPLDYHFFNEEQIFLAEDIAKRYLCSPGKVIASIIPGSLKRTPLSIQCMLSRCNLNSLTKDSSRYLQLVGLWNSGKLIDLDHKDLIFLENKEYALSSFKKQDENLINLLLEEEKTLSFLLQKFSKKKIISFLQNDFVKIKKNEDNIGFEFEEYTLNSTQNEIVNKISLGIESKSFNSHLIHGITGSGKTFIYFDLIRRTLQQKRSVLLLCPEIALGLSIFKRVKDIVSFPHIYFYTGIKKDKEKREIFLKVLNNISVVVGTRSSVFLPFKNLGLIIVDEEHVESYKQEQGGFFYQTKEIVHFLAKKNKATLVLGSATPDVKTYYAAENKILDLHILDKRFGKSVSPVVKILDKNKEKTVEGIFTTYSWNKLIEYINSDEKIIILHNKRGYAHILYCTQCGEIVKCSNCDVTLTYHKKEDKLLCHYCGNVLKMSAVCPKCLSSSFKYYQEGTEKVEEIIQRNFPQLGVLRLDRDVIKKEEDLKQVLREFEQGEAKILVGTQMLSKGHDFSQVGLGIVLDGDFGLSFPDYRATERMFQLLVQLIGRVGRRDKQGEVLIQTRDPQHFFWDLVKKEDYEGFYKQEIEKRKIFSYPPFVKLGLIKVTFPKSWAQEEEFLGELKKYSQLLGLQFSGKVLGPVPAIIAYLKKRQRYHLLLKADNWLAIRKFYFDLGQRLNKFLKSGKVKLDLDLDPLSIL
ncbi:MAG: Primosomal protein N [Desulfonauticus sp. 38_4375]|nr:MAG: Primosomal protein N [Desulfonauticus sp. 38_4375]